MKQNYLWVCVFFSLATGLGCMAVRAQDVNDCTNDSLIREDRVWEYAYRCADVWDGEMTNVWDIMQMKFEGTEERDGVEYARFVLKSVQTWTFHADVEHGVNGILRGVRYPDDDEVHLMREESGRAWTWIEPADRKGYLEDMTEALVYDSTVSAGECVEVTSGRRQKLMTATWPGVPESLECVSRADIEVGNGESVMLTFRTNRSDRPVCLIGGVGFTSDYYWTGILPVPEFFSDRTVNPYMTFLIRQYDVSGIVLYENRHYLGTLVPVPAGLRLSGTDGVPVTVSTDTRATRWYTLQGMPVSEPEHGQVLIRVTSGRAEKVRY